MSLFILNNFCSITFAGDEPYWVVQMTATGANPVMKGFNTKSSALQWLSNGPDRYKGHINFGYKSRSAEVVRFRYVLAPFDPRSNKNWIGDSYIKSGQIVLE